MGSKESKPAPSPLTWCLLGLRISGLASEIPWWALCRLPSAPIATLVRRGRTSVRRTYRESRIGTGAYLYYPDPEGLQPLAAKRRSRRGQSDGRRAAHFRAPRNGSPGAIVNRLLKEQRPPGPLNRRQRNRVAVLRQQHGIGIATPAGNSRRHFRIARSGDAYGRVPSQLRELQIWLPFRTSPRPSGGVNKIPYNRHGRKAKYTDPVEWMWFNDALKQMRKGGYAGLGIVVSKEMGLLAIDFDHCISNGTLDGYVEQHVASLNHCCPRRDRPVARTAENTRVGGSPVSYLGGGLRFEVSGPVQVIPKPG